MGRKLSPTLYVLSLSQVQFSLHHCTDLSLLEKADIAKRIGTKFGDLLDDIAELDRMAAHF